MAAAEHVAQLREKRRRRAQQQVAIDCRLKQREGRSAPNQSRYDDVGVKNGPHRTPASRLGADARGRGGRRGRP